MHRALNVLALLLSLLVLPLARAAAQAPKVALLPPKVESGAHADTAWRISTTLLDELVAMGFDPLPPTAVSSHVGPALRGCAAAECAARIRKLLEVSSVISVNLFHMTTGESLSVALVDGSGTAYSGHASISASLPLERAATAALQQALKAQERGPGPWLAIHGEPAGAHVLLNGKPVGHLPRAMVMATPGINDIRVHKEGYEDFREARDISADRDEIVDITVQLDAAPQPLSARYDSHEADEITRGLDWNPIVGAAAIGVGALLLVKPVLSAAQAGDCARRVAGECVSTHRFTETATWHTVLGSLAIAAGAAVLIAHPLPVSASIGPEHASVHATGNF